MHKNSYIYYTNGLYISSEIKFPELIEKEGKPDVFITFGKTPENLLYPIFKRAFQQANQNEYLLDIKHAARYWLKNKHEIVVEPYSNVQEDAIRIYILSSLMGAVSHKHGFLPIHSCCIKVDNFGVLIAGDSGVGKSTISLGLYRKGYEILNDDVSTVFFQENNVAFVHPGYVHIKLWSESLEKYGYQASDFRQIRNEIQKYSFPINRSNNCNALPLKAVFILQTNGSELHSELITGMKAFEAINKNTFRRNLLKGLGLEAAHFKLSALLASKIKVFVVNRPDRTKPEAFADYMERFIKTL